MNNDTLKKLKTMRLPVFAQCYQNQLEDEMTYLSMSFQEWSVIIKVQSQIARK